MTRRPAPHPVEIGLGVAAAGAVAVLSVVGHKLAVHRRIAYAMDTGDDYTYQPDRECLVVTDDGVPLHVEIDDPGPDAVRGRDGEPITVIFSHGYTLNLSCWVFQRRALANAGYRVVLWDQRAHGKSERADPATYTIDQLGHDLRRIIEDVAPTGDLVLVGHSMGGMTMASLAGLDRELVERRVIAAAFVSTSPGGIPLALGGIRGEIARSVFHRFGIPVFGRLSKRQDVIDGMLRTAREIELAFTERFSFGSSVPASIVALTADMIFTTPLDVMTEFVATFDGYDKRSSLRAFARIETLVFNGVDDVLTPPEHSELLVRGIPGAEHVLVRDAGHIIMLEHPELLNEQLLGLIERARRTPADIEAPRPARVERVVTDLAQRRRVAAADATVRRRPVPVRVPPIRRRGQQDRRDA